MNLKWLFWAGLLAIVVFFSAVYFGMKYNWASGSHSSASNSRSTANQTPAQPQISSRLRTDEAKPSGLIKKHSGPPAILIEEDTPADARNTLGSAVLTIEEVVTKCQHLSESIGIPEQKLKQAVIECVDRNSNHLTTQDGGTDNRETVIREQCDMAITQKELLSTNEIKMLVDECVASMTLQ